MQSNEESIYWYSYVEQILADYYKTTTDFSSDDKETILEYLKDMKADPILAADSKEKSDLLNSVIEHNGNRLAELRVKAKSLLQKNILQIWIRKRK